MSISDLLLALWTNDKGLFCPSPPLSSAHAGTQEAIKQVAGREGVDLSKPRRLLGTCTYSVIMEIMASWQAGLY